MQADRRPARVGYAGPREPTPAILTALHRAHLLAIPYDDLDIHFGRALTLDPTRFFEELVTNRRGALADRCRDLQTSSASGFGHKTVCQRRVPTGVARGGIRVAAGGPSPVSWRRQ